MKKLMLISFALALVMSLLALAQEATKPGEMKQETPKAEKASAKAVSLSGKVSADGKRSSTRTTRAGPCPTRRS